MSPIQHEKEMLAKIEFLKDRLEHLRIGRRILMNLLEITEEEKKNQILQLERENQLLRNQNKKFAKELIILRSKKGLH